ncbi:MAG: methyltransferase domain-containing protein [Actinomycetota bacterium]
MTLTHDIDAVPCLVSESGDVLFCGVDPWLSDPRPEECAVLGRAVAPVLDVGCGPGRHVLELAERGVMALGVDAAPSAVTVAHGRGAPVLQRSIFDPIPGAGRWGTALLLDGSIGIGGDPAALLRRLAGLLREEGLVLAEVEDPGVEVGPVRARIEVGSHASVWFPWARVGVTDLPRLASSCNYDVVEIWEGAGRWFATLGLRSSPA